jgi:hypothetical protein
MKTVLKVLAAVAALYVAYAVAARGLMLNWIHDWVQNHFGDLTGADQTVGWLVALALLALIRLVRWRPLVMAPLTGGAKSLLGFAAICLGAAGILKFTNARIPFGPDGDAHQSYVETIDGPQILDAPPGGIDPKTGLPRLALTAEALRAITISKNNNNGVAHTDPNHYFSASDGKYKVWFMEGSCEMRSAAGFDDRGRKLVPATAELVDRCEKLRTETDRKRKAEAERQSRREAQEQHRARRREFQEIGDYTAAGRFTVIDGVKITFESCEVLRHQTRIKFRIAHLPADGESVNFAGGRFEFSLLNSDGTETRSIGLHRVQGVIASAAQDGILLAPEPGASGRVVVEFQRDSESGGFAIAINHAVAFANPAGHIVTFRPF